MNTAPDFKIRQQAESYLKAHNGWIESDTVAFRPYQIGKDMVVDRFTPNSWNMMFVNTNEDDLKLWRKNFIDRYLLVSCDKKHHKPFGFLVIQELHDLKTATFHGGIWAENIHIMWQVFEGINCIIELLTSWGYNLQVTCFVNNIRADKMQRALGFREFKQEDGLSYKRLDEDSFLNNIVNRRKNLEER